MSNGNHNAKTCIPGQAYIMIANYRALVEMFRNLMKLYIFIILFFCKGGIEQNFLKSGNFLKSVFSELGTTFKS